MPYEIKKVEGGYYVVKTDNTRRRFSGKPLTKKQAKKQRIAIILSELGLSKKWASFDSLILTISMIMKKIEMVCDDIW